MHENKLDKYRQTDTVRCTKFTREIENNIEFFRTNYNR